MQKNPIWNCFNILRDNYFASSRDDKVNMIKKFYSDMVRQGKKYFSLFFFIDKCHLLFVKVVRN